MNAPRPFLVLGFLLAGPALPSAVIPGDTVKNDVFGAAITDIAQIDHPIDGLLFQLEFDGFPEFEYDIRSSLDLQAWFRRGSAVAAGGHGVFTEPFPADLHRYYQVAVGNSADTTPPTWPALASNATFSADNVEAYAVDLDWPAANDDTAIVAYALYQDGEHLATIGPNGLGAFVDGLQPNTVYEFDVVACDRGGNCTQFPATLTIRTRNPQEPRLNAPRAGSAFLSSGEFTLSRTDLAIPARELGFVFTRTYRSDFERSGPLGYGWTANIFERLRERPNGDVVWLQGIGRVDTFVAQPGGGYVAPPGVFIILTKSAAGFRLVDPAGTTRLFGPAGKIQSITTRNSNTLAYNRTGGQLTSLTDDMGRETMLIYGADDRIERITDFTGRSVEYTYDAGGNLISARSPLVTGTPNGNDFPSGKTESYLYDTANPDPDLAHNLIGVISPNEVADATLTPSQTITYGSGGALHDRIRTRTIGGTNASGIPAGGTVTYTYTANPNPGATGLLSRTTITDRRGNEIHHDFTLTGHLERKIEVLAGRPNPITSYTYDAEGHVLTLTHPEGNVTTRAYDTSHSARRSQGNLLRVTHTPGPRGAAQAQIVTSMTYEPIYNQVRTTTDPRGFNWTNIFDYEEACDHTAIGARIGLSGPEALDLLTTAGMCLNAGPPVDLNGDGLLDQVSGNVIRKDHPTVALDPLSHQAVLTGEASQRVVEIWQYNSFGQVVAHRDAEKNVHQFTYFPESDPNGDGTPENPAGDATTGGYLSSSARDVLADPLRNSKTDPRPTVITTSYAYNARGALTSAFDPRGVETSTILNQLDQPVRILRAASVGNAVPNPPEPVPLTPFAFVTDLFYDANNNLVQHDVEDRGNDSDTAFIVTDSNTYDLLNRRLSTTEEIDRITTRTTSYRYDPNGNLALTIHPVGNAVSHQYEERNLVTTTTTGALAPPPEAQLPGSPTFNPRGGAPSSTTFHYDDNGHLDSATDAADTDGSAANNGPSGGELTTYAYDGFDRLVGVVDPTGNLSETSYDPNHNVLRVRGFGPDGGPTPPDLTPSTNLLTDTRYHYDELNRVTQTDRALFANNKPGADLEEGATGLGKGDLVPGDGAVNSRYEYDALGRLTFSVEDDEDVYQTNYDGAGRILSTIDPAGNSVRSIYDDNNNLIETRETDVSTRTGVADEIFLTTYFYDSLNRLARSVDNIGHATGYLYDSRDNLLATSDANGPVTGASITRRAFPNGPLTVNDVNERGNVTRYTYDGLNRLLRTEQVLTSTGLGDGTFTPAPDPAQGGGDGLITNHAIYDHNSLVAARLDDREFQTGYTYDNLNRLIVEARGSCSGPAPSGYLCDPPTSLMLTWDRDHNLIEKVDETGSVLEYTYDGLNRLTEIDITRGPGVGGTTARQYEYDGLGRLTRSFDDNGNAAGDGVESAYCYDSLSRVIEESLLPDPASAPSVTRHGWRAGNLRAGLRYPNGRTLVYQYDALDRPTDLRNSGGTAAIAECDYIGRGRLLETRYPINGTRHTTLNNTGTAALGYDGIRRAIGVRDLDGLNNVITGFGPTYDRTSNRLSEQKLHDPANNESYVYDSAYRLTNISRGPGLGAVPLLHRVFTIDGNNNWQQIDAESRQHSSFNEVVARLPGPINVASDSNGNVTNSGTGQSYQWDAFNRLVTVQRGATPIARYFYDSAGRRVRKENTNLGPALNGTTEYLYAGRDVIEERDGAGASLRQFIFGPGIDNPLRMDDLLAASAFYYHKNTLGSTFALTNAATGAVAERMLYDAYGNPAFTQVGGAPPSGNPFLFTGRRLDPATGNYYYRARYLDPVQGRFLSRDPLGIWGDYRNAGNPYAYCNNNPVNCVDPSGLETDLDVIDTHGTEILIVILEAVGSGNYLDTSGDGQLAPIDALAVQAGSANSLVINLSLGWEPRVADSSGPLYPAAWEAVSGIVTDNKHPDGHYANLAGNDNEWRSTANIFDRGDVDIDLHLARHGSNDLLRPLKPAEFLTSGIIFPEIDVDKLARGYCSSDSWSGTAAPAAAHSYIEEIWTDMRPLSFMAGFSNGAGMIQRYLAAESSPKQYPNWTDFNDSDPGMTMLNAAGSFGQTPMGVNRPNFGSGWAMPCAPFAGAGYAGNDPIANADLDGH